MEQFLSKRFSSMQTKLDQLSDKMLSFEKKLEA